MGDIPPRPAPIEGLDDRDHLIYDLYWRQHKSLRDTAVEVGMSHEGVRYRIRRMMPWIRHEDHEQLRDEEGVRLTELRNQATRLLAVALGDPTNPDTAPDLTNANRALREIHSVTRTMIELYGLERRPGERGSADPADINDLFDAYFQGHADATAAAEPVEGE